VSLLIALSWAVSALAEHVPKAELPAGFELVWNDEFNGDALDTTKWRVRQANRPRAHTVIDPGCVGFDGRGNLVLTTRWDPESETYRIGQIGTSGIYEARYGYFESRIKFQQHDGHHGAFWIQSNHLTDELDNHMVSGTEIDIIEHFGPHKSMSFNLHWNGYGEHHQHLGERVRSLAAADASQDFHVYGCLWTEDAYVFYVDGREAWRTSEAVSGIHQYLILSLLSSGWEKDRLDATRAAGGLPDSMLVDYVRVYQRDDQAD
ncbi:MAG: glycoside hydrolase family 16 protein, partial [Planctomycetota bacterium]